MPLSPTAVLAFLIAALVLEYVMTTVAELLQLRHQPLRPPPEIADAIDEEHYRRSRDYASERTRANRAEGAIVSLVWIALLTTGALGATYEAVAGRSGGGLLAALVFLAGLAFAFDLLTLPFSIWRTFGIEERFGFNRTTVATFVRDRLIGYAVALILGGGLVALLLASYQWWGRAFWMPYAAVVAVVLVLLSTFQTSLLLPLFNKLTPLESGALKDAIARYVADAGYRLDDVYVMDGSKRSSKANAFFSGLGPVKRVVLFDTLIERHAVDEIVAVVAHEVGHQRHRHVPQLVIGNVALLTFLIFLASRVIDAPVVSQALGADVAVPALNLVAIVLLFGPVTLLLGTLLHAVQRRFEYQADAFAAKGHGADAMVAALRRLVADSLSLTTAHPFYAALRLSHPAPVDRIRAIEADA